MSKFNPYPEALAMIEQSPGTGGAASMAKLVLSLYNSQCGFAFSECIGNLDTANTSLALKIVTHYAAYGETIELCAAGKLLADERYPNLWEMGIAMSDAREALRAKWKADERKAELDALRAAEGIMLTESSKMLAPRIAKELLPQGDTLYASYHCDGDWRDTKLSRDQVHAAIDFHGAELSSNCPENSQMLAVSIGKHIYYLSTDYDAREAYLDTVRPARKAIPRVVSVRPRR